MKPTSTPLPWDFDATGKYYRKPVIRNNGMVVCTMHDLGFESHGDRKANAQLIVTAVNNHDRLVALVGKYLAATSRTGQVAVLVDRSALDAADAEARELLAALGIK